MAMTGTLLWRRKILAQRQPEADEADEAACPPPHAYLDTMPFHYTEKSHIAANPLSQNPVMHEMDSITQIPESVLGSVEHPAEMPAEVPAAHLT